MTLPMRTALRVCSFLIYFKAFPANLFKSMNLVFCGFSEKGIWKQREETVEVPSSQDFPCIRWREGVELEELSGWQGVVDRVLGCGKTRRCLYT